MFEKIVKFQSAASDAPEREWGEGKARASHKFSQIAGPADLSKHLHLRIEPAPGADENVLMKPFGKQYSSLSPPPRVADAIIRTALGVIQLVWIFKCSLENLSSLPRTRVRSRREAREREQLAAQTDDDDARQAEKFE